LHPGYGDGGAATAQVREANLNFARIALEESRKANLRMGYECFDLALIREISHPRFGFLFDIGHAALRLETAITLGILRWMEELLPYIVQFHVHGVRLLERGCKEDHLSLHANNAIDYAQIVQAMKSYSFAGPVILEIENSDQYENLKNSISGREELLAMWE